MNSGQITINLINVFMMVEVKGGGWEEGGVSPSQVSAVLLALSHTFAMDFEHSSPGSKSTL